MSKFSSEEYLIGNIDKNVIIKAEYKKMLNNLLGISARDNSIFSSSKINNIDLFDLISEEDYNKIFNNETFKVEILNVKNDDLITNLTSSENIDEFIEIADENALNISITDRKLLEKSFETNKTLIIEKIKQTKNQIISKWKRIKNKYQDIQSQTNSWPLYIGSMFIKVRTTKSTLYAPLLLKKVEIEITNTNKIFVKSIDSSIDINEKLLFLLQNEYKFNLPKLIEKEDFSFWEVIEEFTKDLHKIINKDFDFLGKFTFYTKKSVNNKELEYSKGAVLTFSQPLGGTLRDKLIKMINDNSIEDVLDVDVLKNINEEVMNSLLKQEKIFRITPTDISQEKAIIGSMIDSSIIWGPPGTGKSQTISNIIANLMHQNKNVIVTSEKKAALDVIKDRMGVLNKYIFFGLVDKNINKEEFYKPFQDLIKKIRDNNNFSGSPKNSSTISSESLKYNDLKTGLKNENIESLIYFDNIDKELKRLLLEQNNLIKNSCFIKSIIKTKNFNNSINECRIEKRGFIFKKFPKDVIFYQTNIEKGSMKLETIEHFLKLLDPKKILKISNLLKTEDNYRTSLMRSEFINDIEYLDNLFALNFKKKIDALKSSPQFSKKLKTFLKNCESGFRIPYKFVDIHKEIIKKLFSVFVSTPQTLSSIIDMDSQYDYVIFDEASQLHLEKAIPFIGISKKSIIAGDNEQMRPTSYFTTRDKTILEDDSEENVDSLLDYAYRKGLKGSREYMLTKNYRSSSSELMLFSSKEFYNSKLDVIDDLNNFDKSIEVYDIDGKWEGRVNEKEAISTLNKTLECLNEFNSIIILSFNSTQKQYIESLIYDKKNYEPIIEALKDGAIKLRNLENIQGDEADLVIVSVAYDKSSRLGSTYVGKSTGRNALNVAISRGKKKMIIMKSIKSSDIIKSHKSKSIETLRKWLEYLEMNSNQRKKYINLEDIEHHKNGEEFDSSFEEDVYDLLVEKLKTKRKLFITTQYCVGSYRIDLAIMDSKNNEFILGIEVDGYKYHSGFEKMIKDIERQKFLEAKKYPIYRITELNWKINNEKEINKIFELLV